MPEATSATDSDTGTDTTGADTTGTDSHRSTPANGIEIRELHTPDDLSRLTGVFDDVWHPDPTNRPVSTDMLRALAHAGNYVAGAYVGGRLAGGSVGFFAAPVGEVLHSHMTGVSRRGHGHNVGFALKLHQRRWALDRGITTITWTFDPLVARNAYFNIAKLGAVPLSYHRDFYGDIGDELGGADESDRMLMAWSLADDAPIGNRQNDPHDVVADGAVSAIDVDDPDRPVARPELITDDATVVVPVPRDIEAMRRHAAVVASRWRVASREALTPLLDDAASNRSVRFLRSGHYVFGPAGSGKTQVNA